MLKKIGIVTFADAITKGIGYLLLPVYLGLMPQHEYGEYGFILSFVGPFSLIIGLSVYVPFIRNFCVDNADISTQEELVSTVFIIFPKEATSKHAPPTNPPSMSGHSISC